MSDWNNCFDIIVLVSKIVSLLHGKEVDILWIAIIFNPWAQNLHQNNTQIICKVIGDNGIYCCVCLIEECTALESQSIALVLLVISSFL